MESFQLNILTQVSELYMKLKKVIVTHQYVYLYLGFHQWKTILFYYLRYKEIYNKNYNNIKITSSITCFDLYFGYFSLIIM